MSSSPLSNEQIEHFKTHGFLVLENLLDEASLEGWRAQIWRELGSSLETPETWPRERSGLDGYEYDPPESTFGLHPKLTAIREQLGGGNFILGDGIPIIRWPDSSQDWQKPRSGHVDAYGGKWLPFMYGATAYLYDVEPGGGSFFFWPGSHHTAHRFFRQHPHLVNGSFLKDKNFDWRVFCDDPENGGVEFSAKAGDVVLWHAYLTHESSLNIRQTPRIAMFTRYDHKERFKTSVRHDVPEDLWKYWAI